MTLRERFSTYGWAILPLRLFLGITFIYAGLLKFFDPNYLNAASPNGVQHQMAASAISSPISMIVGQAAEHATLFGLTIALGELLVGLGVLLGVFTRLAAVGGFLLSLSFFLTVSWGTSPYFTGADIVFMFAFLPLALAGDGGVLSVAAAIRTATRRRMRLAVPAPRDESAQVTAMVQRRALVQTGVVAVLVGVGAVLVGGVGRLVSGGGDDTASGSGPTPSSTPSSAPSAPGSEATSTPAPMGGGASGAAASGTAVGTSADLKVGGALPFTDPASGAPGYVVQPKAGTYMAFSAVCTHEGCTVGFDQAANQFACPCHGARFDASNGDVVRGPARDPLQKYSVTEAGGTLYIA